MIPDPAGTAVAAITMVLIAAMKPAAAEAPKVIRAALAQEAPRDPKVRRAQ